MKAIDPTIFIIEDDPAVLRSLSWVFESVGLRVETYSDGIEYLRAYDGNRWGCHIIDVRLPSMSGLELLDQLTQRNNRMPVIIITGHGDISLAIRALQAGARDFILKPFNYDLLLETTQKVIIESKEEQLLYQQFFKRLSKLTPRESEVMRWVVVGKTNKAIASKLKISVSTVEQHRIHFMQKLQIKSLVELIKIHTLINGHHRPNGKPLP